MSSSSSIISTIGDNPTLKIKPLNGKIFRIKKNLAIKFGTLKGMIDSGCTDDSAVIQLPIVGPKEWAKAVSLIVRPDKESAIEILRGINQANLYDLFLAADFLDCPEVIDLCAEQMTAMIRGKMPEEIRTTFGIVNDFGSGEEEAIRAKNPWAFE